MDAKMFFGLLALRPGAWAGVDKSADRVSMRDPECTFSAPGRVWI